MKALSKNSFLARLLDKLAAAVIRNPRLFFYPQIILFVLSILGTVFFLQFDMDRDHLVGSNQPYQQNYLAFRKEFPQQDDLVIVVESEDVEKNRQFVERIGAKLTARTNLFTDVFYKGDLPLLGNKALLFLTEDDLKGLKGMLREDMPFIEKFTQTTNLVSFFNEINAAIRTTPRDPTNTQTTSLIQSLPALERIIVQATDSLDRPGTPPSPSVTALFNPDDVLSNYITFAKGKIFLATAHAPSEEANGKAVEELRRLVDETKNEVGGVNAGLTGEPVLDHDEMEQSQKDTTLASIVSLVLCALIFVYGYNETGRPVKATLCLIVGMAYTLAFATLTVGHLNILTITFVPILIGLAIDYGVHLVTRYEEELRHGKTKEAALTTAMVCTGQGIFTGALTTAGAFLAMSFTNFKGIQEMGIICGGGLLVCFVPMMTLLPILLLRGRQNVIDRKLGDTSRRERIENIWLQRPWIVTGITASLSLLALFSARHVRFDYNLLHMQSPGLPAVVYEQKLIDSAEKSVLFGAVTASNLEDAVVLESRLKSMTNIVADVQSIAAYLNGDQEKKLKLIGEIKDEVGALQFAEPDPQPVDIHDLSVTLYSSFGYLGDAIEAVGADDPELARKIKSLHTAIERFRIALLRGTAMEQSMHAQKLGEFQRALMKDIRDTFQTLQRQDNGSPLRADDLPPALRDRFIGVTGKFLLQVYPRKDLWQREHQQEFITEIRKLYPTLTGTPVQLYEYTDLLMKSYIQAAWYSLIAIALMVLFHFRSPLAVVLALIPVGIGSVWLLGLMGAFGAQFNPANIMTLPLVIGIGVTNGIQILNRYAEEHTPSILTRSTGKAVLVSGLTAIAGFGSLIIAQHRGIHSLGCVMSVGIATCMVAGLTFLPALLNLIGRKFALIKQQPSVSKPPTPGQEEPR